MQIKVLSTIILSNLYDFLIIYISIVICSIIEVSLFISMFVVFHLILLLFWINNISCYLILGILLSSSIGCVRSTSAIICYAGIFIGSSRSISLFLVSLIFYVVCTLSTFLSSTIYKITLAPHYSYLFYSLQKQLLSSHSWNSQ